MDVNLQRADHSLENHEGHPATETDNGNIEYWTCSVCDKYFADSFGKSEIGEEDIIIQDNTRIERFGEKVKEADATKKVLSNGSGKESDNEETEDKGYEELPAETYDEALEFARLEWNKCKRKGSIDE